MPGIIDDRGNIALYLNPQEIKDLPNKNIEGTLIENPKIKRQGKYEISMIEKKIYSGIETNEDNYWGNRLKDFSIKVFMGRSPYQDLLKEGKGYSRKQTNGSEIFIYDSSKVKSFEKMQLENIEWAIENKDELPEIYR